VESGHHPANAQEMKSATPSRSAFKAVAFGFASGLLVAIPAAMAAIASGHAGHGHYVAARGLFPAPMLMTLLEGKNVGSLSIAAALLQFPIYGVLLGWSVARKNFAPAIAIMLAHIITAIVCFAGALPNFS
jgi:hypothetical protein